MPWWANAVFTLVNIFGIQYYTSTGPDQLLRMGDYGAFTSFIFATAPLHAFISTTSLAQRQLTLDTTYTVIMNCITPLSPLGIPLFGWLMDRKGLALTFLVINLLGIGTNNLKHRLILLMILMMYLFVNILAITPILVCQLAS